ncbi:hypothetical protein EC912_108120 [Luteibacter rhizovicinus]|uniref:Uncharacterized protein n=1 Tax=Luteibacter rhizovicinus TaxID=242606 RepID=A0A4R3YIT6_9GAMM|nr:hypothetical protein EC912_108120 [Luteibacter rhizovicinus]
MPDHRSVTSTIRVADGNVGEVTFPQSFGLYLPLPQGTYHWDALVAGKAVVSDDFGR